jgi:YcxB-like protein
MSISVTISVSDDAYHDYAVYVAHTHPVFVRNRKRILATRLFVVSFFVLGLWFGAESMLSAVIAALLGGIWCWYGWFSYPKTVANQQVAIRAAASSHARFVERQFTATEDSITVTDPQMHLELKWPAIRCWGEAPSCIFFTPSPGQAIVVPTSSLSVEVLQELRTLAATRLGAPTDLQRRVQRRAA